ncbi:allantoicase [Nocardioides guangzhouensis]|uniref:Probable allantoicase n=1 Tax=Nocardioides guangzhouensis TaxID=2497878 RepID=A0A4Q4ZL07_9ACTN|nr:allantoicase [Nocardioides guangzhouensis]RYP88261.1 allantoicase [Nocardioides guangzhouensis]
MTDFRGLTDLASRAFGGSVVAANDEFFAPRENLVRPEPPQAVHTFGHKGKEYDGWETRRRREPGSDWAVVRLGEPGVVRGVVVDTAFFTGNYPPEVSVEAAVVDGYPAADELPALTWTTLVERSAALGDTANAYPVADDRVWTHVRLTIHPDGGVARFRVHGEARPDPRFAGGTDLAARENGGSLVACSDAFYGSAARLIEPGRARHMGEGWENARRRDGGNDWALFRLGLPGLVRHVELDTSYFLGNAPGEFRLSGCSAAGADLDDPAEAFDEVAWFDLVPRRPARPDTRHRFLVAEHRTVTHVRVDVYPDGGMARLRVWGDPVPAP